MQSVTARPVLSRLFGTALLTFSLLTGTAALAAAGDNGPDISDAVATLKTKLSLSDQQAAELKAALTDFARHQRGHRRIGISMPRHGVSRLFPSEAIVKFGDKRGQKKGPCSQLSL